MHAWLHARAERLNPLSLVAPWMLGACWVFPSSCAVEKRVWGAETASPTYSAMCDGGGIQNYPKARKELPGPDELASGALVRCGGYTLWTTGVNEDGEDRYYDTATGELTYALVWTDVPEPSWCGGAWAIEYGTPVGCEQECLIAGDVYVLVAPC